MKRSIFKTGVLLIIFLLSNSVWSQQSEYITGKLLDAKTQEALAFVNIRLKDRALGIISNGNAVLVIWYFLLDFHLQSTFLKYFNWVA